MFTDKCTYHETAAMYNATKIYKNIFKYDIFKIKNKPQAAVLSCMSNNLDCFNLEMNAMFFISITYNYTIGQISW